MTWLWIALAIVGVLIVVGIFIKLYTRRRLRDIDGLHGVHKGEDNIIASIGDDPNSTDKK